VLDRSIGHPLSFQRIIPALQKRFPEWAENFPAYLPPLLEVEAAEHRKAHRIVVASSFTRRTLIENGVPNEKIEINPYGVDTQRFSPSPRPCSGRQLRFVFLGALSARKGLPLLLRAWRSLSTEGAELWLVGPVSEANARLLKPMPGLKVIGKIPHEELPALLRQCDVLVFPSYFEGFGLVILEALACGLPVIATEATAAPDLIKHGVEGYIVPTGDLEALRDALQRFIFSPSDLERMSCAARLCAERYSWDAYGDRWFEILHNMV
jgi:glycosyltransferase involved in cell wall biosynthesis